MESIRTNILFTLKHLGVFFFLVLLLLPSCQNEVDKFVPDEFIGPGDYQDALILIQNMEREFYFDIEKGITMAVGRSVISIPPHAFIYRDNSPVAGRVLLTVTEIHQQKDFIKYDFATEDMDGKILEAEVFTRVAAKNNVENLKVNTSADPIVITTFDDTPEMGSVYELVKIDQANFWEETNTFVKVGAVTVEYQGAVKDTSGYQFEVTSSNWMGIQRTVQVADFSAMCLDLLDSNTPENTRAYLVFDEFNTCLRLNVSNTVDCVDSNVPLNENGVLVVLAHKGMLNGTDLIEAGSEYVTINGPSTVVDLQPRLIPKEELLPFIEGL